MKINEDMASTKAIFPPPEQFSFKASDWLSWSKLFKRYHSISGLSTKPHTVQVDALIYVMGPLAEGLLTSFHLTDNDLKDFKKVFDTFETHYIGQ